MLRVRALCLCSFVFAGAPLLGQSAQLPALPSSPSPQGTPAQPTRSIFTVPRSDAGLIALPAKDKPTPAPTVPKEACYGPAEGPFAPRPPLSPELQEVEHRYTSLAVHDLGTTWFRGMPRAANDPWVKAAKVTVRFAILKDGSIDTPRVTVSSGRESYDRHALDAIYKTPFAPLPDGIGSALPICMTFGYNVQENEWKKPLDLWPTKPTASPPPPTAP